MYSKNLEETIRSLQAKKHELEKQAEDLHLQLKTVTEHINVIKKKFDTFVINTNITTQLYDRALKECRTELTHRNQEQTVDKKKVFALSDIREKILEKKLPKNASITELASQLASNRKQ